MRLQLTRRHRRSGAAMRRKRPNRAAARRARERRRQRRRLAQAERARPRAHRERARAARPRAARRRRFAAHRGALRLSLLPLCGGLDRGQEGGRGRRAQPLRDRHPPVPLRDRARDRVGLGIDVAHEAMSGATPWYITPDADGEPVQVMTQATIEEARTDALLSGDLYFDRGKATLGGGVSSENDYLAFNAQPRRRAQFNEKNTTLSGGIGALDRPASRRPTPASTRPGPNRRTSRATTSTSRSVRCSGRATIVQTSVKYQLATGFLSDPYKLASWPASPRPTSGRTSATSSPGSRASAITAVGRGHAAPRLHALRRRLGDEFAHLRARLVPDAVRSLPARALGALLLAESGRLLRAVLRGAAQRWIAIERLSALAVRGLLVWYQGRVPARSLEPATGR